MLVCYGASDAAVSTPYQPLREWLEFLLRVCDPEALAECLGDGRRDAGAARARARGADRRGRRRAGDETTDRYRSRAPRPSSSRGSSRMQPLLLVADDLHWADGETLHLLRRLARAAPGGAAARRRRLPRPGEEIGPELADTLADLSRLDGVTRLALGSLSAEEVGAFVRASTDAEASRRARVGDRRAHRRHAAAALRALARPARERRASRSTDASVTLVAAARRAARPASGSATSSRQRLSRLAPETAAMLELAAVTGPRFELRVLAEAAGLDQAPLAARRGGGPERDRRGAARAGARLPLHARARPPRGLRPDPARRAAPSSTSASARRSSASTPPTRRASCPSSPTTSRSPLPSQASSAPSTTTCARPRRRIAAAAYDEAAARLSTALELGIADPRERARVQVELAYLLDETGRSCGGRGDADASLEAATGLGERGLAARALVQRRISRLTADPAVDPEEMRRPSRRRRSRRSGQLGDERGLAVGRAHCSAMALLRQGRVAGRAAPHSSARSSHAEASGDRRRAGR